MADIGPRKVFESLAWQLGFSCPCDGSAEGLCPGSDSLGRTKSLERYEIGSQDVFGLGGGGEAFSCTFEVKPSGGLSLACLLSGGETSFQ